MLQCFISLFLLHLRYICSAWRWRPSLSSWTSLKRKRIIPSAFSRSASISAVCWAGFPELSILTSCTTEKTIQLCIGAVMIFGKNAVNMICECLFFPPTQGGVSPSAAESPPGWAAPHTPPTPSGPYWRPSEVAPACSGGERGRGRSKVKNHFRQGGILFYFTQVVLLASRVHFRLCLMKLR